MPGTVTLVVLEVVDLPPAAAGKNFVVKVKCGSRQNVSAAQAAFSPPSGSSTIQPYNVEFSFPVMNLQDPLEVSLVEVSSGQELGQGRIAVSSVVEKGSKDEMLLLSNSGRVRIKSAFILTEEERAKIAAMRAKAMQRRELKGDGAAGSPRGTSSPTPTHAAVVSQDVPPANPSHIPVQPPLPIVVKHEPPVQKSAPIVVKPDPPVQKPAPIVVKPDPPVQTPAPPVAKPEPPVQKPEPPVQPPAPVAAKPDPTLQPPASVVAKPHTEVPPPKPRQNYQASSPNPEASPASHASPVSTPASYVRPGTTPAQRPPGPSPPVGTGGVSTVDTTPMDPVKARIAALEVLRQEVENAPVGSVTRAQASERLRRETEATAAAEAERSQQNKRLMARSGGGGSGIPWEDEGFRRLAKQVAGGVGVLLSVAMLWPRGKKGREYTVRKGDYLCGIVPQHYCNPKSKFFELNPEVCDVNYIYEGQRLRLP